jgi:hypothetical protein
VQDGKKWRCRLGLNRIEVASFSPQSFSQAIRLFTAVHADSVDRSYLASAKALPVHSPSQAEPGALEGAVRYRTRFLWISTYGDGNEHISSWVRCAQRSHNVPITVLFVLGVIGTRVQTRTIISMEVEIAYQETSTAVPLFPRDLSSVKGLLACSLKIFRFSSFQSSGFKPSEKCLESSTVE